MFDHFWFKKEYPYFKKIVNFFFWFFIFLTFFFFLEIDPNRPDPKFFGFMAFVSALALIAPTFISRWGKLGKIYNRNFIYTIEFLVTLSLIFGWFGAKGGLGLFWIGIGYDSLNHFAVSALIFGCLFLLSFHYFKKYWQKKNKIIPLLVIFLATMFLGVFNEFFEKYGDIFLGTGMYGEPGEPLDTVKDLIYDALGAAGALAVCYFKGEDWIKKFELKKEKINWKEKFRIKRRK